MDDLPSYVPPYLLRWGPKAKISKSLSRVSAEVLAFTMDLNLKGSLDNRAARCEVIAMICILPEYIIQLPYLTKICF